MLGLSIKIAFATLAILVCGQVGLIIYHSAGYATNYSGVPFVIDKGSLAFQQPWRAILLLHVVSGIVCLLSCLGQFSRRLRHRLPALHRRLGHLFAWSMLLLVIPSGTYLALHAFGGMLGTIGFLLNGFLAAAFTILGLKHSLRKELRQHAAWMTRAFAMAASAVTFRYLHFLLGYVNLPQTLDYLLSLWGSIILNYLLAEIVIGLVPFFRQQGPRHLRTP